MFCLALSAVSWAIKYPLFMSSNTDRMAMVALIVVNSSVHGKCKVAFGTLNPRLEDVRLLRKIIFTVKSNLTLKSKEGSSAQHIAKKKYLK